MAGRDWSSHHHPPVLRPLKKQNIAGRQYLQRVKPPRIPGKHLSHLRLRHLRKSRTSCMEGTRKVPPPPTTRTEPGPSKGAQLGEPPVVLHADGTRTELVYEPFKRHRNDSEHYTGRKHAAIIANGEEVPQRERM